MSGLKSVKVMFFGARAVFAVLRAAAGELAELPGDGRPQHRVTRQTRERLLAIHRSGDIVEFARLSLHIARLDGLQPPQRGFDHRRPRQEPDGDPPRGVGHGGVIGGQTQRLQGPADRAGAAQARDHLRRQHPVGPGNGDVRDRREALRRNLHPADLRRRPRDEHGPRGQDRGHRCREKKPPRCPTPQGPGYGAT